MLYLRSATARTGSGEVAACSVGVLNTVRSVTFKVLFSCQPGVLFPYLSNRAFIERCVLGQRFRLETSGMALNLEMIHPPFPAILSTHLEHSNITSPIL